MMPVIDNVEVLQNMLFITEGDTNFDPDEM